MSATLMRAMAAHPLLGAFGEGDRARILSFTQERRFPPGAVIFRRGLPADALHLVLDGMVGLVEDATDHRHALNGPGSLLGADAALEGACFPVTAEALSEVRTLAIPAEPFRAHLEARVDTVFALLAHTSARLRGHIHEITELKMQSTTRRLARFLVGLTGQMAGPGADGPVHLKLPCEKRALAQRLGMQPESLSRAFAKLRPHGVFSARLEDVEIADIGALRRYCGSDEDDGGAGGWE